MCQQEKMHAQRNVNAPNEMSTQQIENVHGRRRRIVRKHRERETNYNVEQQ